MSLYGYSGKSMTERPMRTERLEFQSWSLDDFELALKLWGDPDVTRLFGGPFSEEWVRERLQREISNLETYGFQYWPVFLLETGEHVGCCGLKPYSSAEPIHEIGFHLHKAHWGRGYGEEAARAVIDLAFNTLGAQGLFAGHHPENHASRGLLQKLGFRYTHHEYFAPTGLQHPGYLLTAGDTIPRR
jgi:ribosomal-protein-alanine N-acetyltransferase